MNQDDAHFIAKKRKYIKYKRNRRLALLALLCIAILVVWIVIISLAVNITRDCNAVTAAHTEEPKPQTSAVTSKENTFFADCETFTLTLSRNAVREGPLVLVSDHLGYGLPPAIPPLTTVWGNKSPTYRVANATLALASDAFFAADKMFCDYYAENSNGDYQITMAYSEGDSPICCGEHGTGYAFDVNVYTSGGQSLRLREAGGIYNWIYENCAEYGFVLRYGEDKTAVTGMTADRDHFRFVGVGHAEYMKEHGMSLEEYIGELQKHVYGEEHLEFSFGGTSYEVFYVGIPSDADGVEIELPKDVLYTVSGDNIGGVVVTLYK